MISTSVRFRAILGLGLNCKRFTWISMISLLLIMPGPSNLFGQVIPSEQRGLPSNSAFSGSDIDQVNLQNGSLHVSIPIVSVAQRGGSTLHWNFVYDTLTWIKQYFPSTNCVGGGGLLAQNSQASPAGLGGGGGGCNLAGQYDVGTEGVIGADWRLTTPYDWGVVYTNPEGGTCPTTNQNYNPLTNFAVVEPDGTEHPLPIRVELGSACYGQTLAGPTLDGSGMYYNYQTGILTLKDGTQIQMNQGQLPTNMITDSNGNESGASSDTIARNLVTVTNGPQITLTTPLGNTGRGYSYTTYTIVDSNGNPQKYTVYYEVLDLNPDFCNWGLPNSATCVLDDNISYPVPSQLILPNGMSYSFTYYNDSAGELKQITLPTGGTISYTYVDNYLPKFVTNNQPDNYVGGKAVATRVVTANGSANTWTYTYSVIQSTVTDPLGNVATHNWDYLSYEISPSIVASSSDMYEMSTTYKDSSGHLLRTIANTYAYEYDPVNNAVANGRIASQVVTLDNGQEKETTTAYETFTYPCQIATYCPATATRLNPTQISDYDYGQGEPGALLRTTTNTYQTFTIGSATISKPATVTIYNGAGTQTAKTIYEYDNYSHVNQPMQSSGAIQHNSSYGTTYTNRANVTAISRWRNTDGALLTTTNQYDDAGNLLSVIDPLGYETSYGYGDSWNNSTCAPSSEGKIYRTTATNAAGQSTSSTFNSCTGTLASTIDPNHETTNLTYDLLNRVVQAGYPDGGSTTYCYSDVEGSPCYNATVWSATETNEINSSTSTVNTNIFDGLGRTIHSELVSDPEGIVTKDTIYDGDGRISQVSNPYRSGDTEYWTNTSYDGIGRVTSITKPDGSIATISYTGNATTSKDEAGSTRESVTDGLGRLTTVYENPSVLNYETDYGYDVLGNVVQVTQKGGSSSSSNWRTRTFAYDSLSELLCSANPEIGSPLNSSAVCPNPDNGTYTTGTVRYQYDNDGNLQSRIAPEENQQGSATVTSSYTYDHLNRALTASYSDGTPTITYIYDGASTLACTLPTSSPSATNLVGRMSGMCDGAGATAWSYDPIGRTLSVSRTTGTVSDQISYKYTYTGIVDQVTYPLAGGTTPFTLSYNVNSAGRVYSAFSGSTTYMQVQSTWATGAPKSYLLGTNIQINASYNPQLQPLTLTAEQVSQSNTLLSKTYSFNQGTGNTGTGNGGGTDNSLLQSVTDGLDALGLDRPNGSMSYTYDSVNRISSAQTPGTACTAVNGGTLNWGDSYTIDPWGNLISKTVTKCSAETLSATANSQNRLSAATYDSAGNVSQYNGLSLVYNGAGQLTSAGGTSYLYDGMGQRVEKPGKLYWRGIGSDSLAETSTSDTTPTLYIFCDGKRIGRIDPGATTPKYYIADNVGSTELVTDYLGNPLSESLFYPYGGEQQILAGDANTYKFTGKERDPETGLDDFGARYYENNLGRFMTPDWDAKPTAVPYASFGDPQTLNLYSYVENAPVNRVDADGHATGGGWIMNFWRSDMNEDDSQNYFQGDSGTPEQQDEAQAEASYLAMVSAATAVAAQASSAASQAQTAPAQQQSTDSSSSSSSDQTHYASVSYWPKSAGGFGHIGIQVDSDDTQGYSTANPKVHWWTRLFGAPAGAPEDDLKAHTSSSGEVAPHSYLHIPITADQAQAISAAMADRVANPGHYNLIFNNCAQFVETVLHAGGVSGVPHAEVFGPAVLGGILWAEH